MSEDSHHRSQKRSSSKKRHKSKKKKHKSHRQPKARVAVEDIYNASSRVDPVTKKARHKPHVVNLLFDVRRPKEGKATDEQTDVSQRPKHLTPEQRRQYELKEKDAKKNAKEEAKPKDSGLKHETSVGARNRMESVSTLQFRKRKDSQIAKAKQRVDTTGKNQAECDLFGWKKKRYWFRHPVFRTFVATFIAVLNFLIYAEDPIAHSQTTADIPIIGFSISLLFIQYPTDKSDLMALKLFFALGFSLLGMFIGRQIIHHKLFREKMQWKMFAENKGTWFTMFFTTIFTTYFGALIYNSILRGLDEEKHSVNLLTTELALTNENFTKIAAVGTWLGDYFTAYMVVDMMLQDTEYPNWAVRARESYPRHRIKLFWFLTPALCALVITFISVDVIEWDSLGDRLIFSTSERARAALAATITLMDLVIVMQDWEFPQFVTNQNINLPGFNHYEVDLAPPKWLEWFTIHITGKWFNYGIITVVMMFDLNMLKNQVTYVPEIYGQYVGPGNNIWTIVNRTAVDLQQACYNKGDSFPCLSDFTFAVRQGSVSGDVETQSEYLGVSSHELGVASLPICLAALLFVVLFRTENPKRIRTDKSIALEQVAMERGEMSPNGASTEPEISVSQERVDPVLESVPASVLEYYVKRKSNESGDPPILKNPSLSILNGSTSPGSIELTSSSKAKTQPVSMALKVPGSSLVPSSSTPSMTPSISEEPDNVGTDRTPRKKKRRKKWRAPKRAKPRM